MSKEKNKKSAKQKLISCLRHRIKLLESARQHYEQNPTLNKNLKIANIELVQNDIESLVSARWQHKFLDKNLIYGKLYLELRRRRA